MFCEPNIQILMKNKKEEFRQKIRRDEMELYFNQNRRIWIQNQSQSLNLYELFNQLNQTPSYLQLIKDLINSPDLSKSDIEQFFCIFESQDSFSQESKQKLNLLLTFLDKDYTLVVEILHGLSFKSVLMTEFFIDQGIITLLLSQLEQNQSLTKIIIFFTQVAQQSITARSSLIRNGIFEKVHRLIDYNDSYLIHQILLMFDAIINIKYRIPREKFSEIIHILNQICKLHDIRQSEFAELYFSILKHYMNGSANHITQVLQKKKILDLIISCVFQCTSQQIQIRALYALAQITSGSEKQNRILLERFPNLVQNIMNVLENQENRNQKLLFKKKLLLTLENLMMDCFHILKEKSTLGQNLAKYLQEDSGHQLQCRILSLLSLFFQSCSINVDQDSQWIYLLLQSLKNLISSKNGEVLQCSLNLLLNMMDISEMDPKLIFFKEMMLSLEFSKILIYLASIFPAKTETFQNICEILEFLQKESMIQE